MLQSRIGIEQAGVFGIAMRYGVAATLGVAVNAHESVNFAFGELCQQQGLDQPDLMLSGRVDNDEQSSTAVFQFTVLPGASSAYFTLKQLHSASC